MLLALFADISGLGRFDPSLISDQDRMEMLVTTAESDTASRKEKEGRYNFKYSSGEFTEACGWDGVTCDGDSNIIYIDWFLLYWACGTVSLDYLPPKLVHFDITRGTHETRQVTGTVSTALLPQTLNTFVIHGNKFQGTIDLTCLPPALVTFRGRFNRFDGTINLESLPNKMQKLDLSGNDLTGTLCLTKLPLAMYTLSLNDNRFTGTIELKNLPPLDVLDLSDNALVGCPSLDDLPAKFGTLHLDNNFLQGENFKKQKVR